MTKLDATVQTNEWGIFALPDILLPDSLRQAGLAGKKIVVSVREADEEDLWREGLGVDPAYSKIASEVEE